jgi:hypothetical protein
LIIMRVKGVVTMPYLYSADAAKDYYVDGRLVNNPISANLTEGIIRYKQSGKVVTELGRIEAKDKRPTQTVLGPSGNRKRSGVGGSAAFPRV